MLWTHRSAFFLGVLMEVSLLGPGMVRAAPVTEPSAVGRIVAQVDAGQFTAAAAHIREALAQPALAPDTHSALEFQRERMRRILLDFPLTEKDVRREFAGKSAISPRRSSQDGMRPVFSSTRRLTAARSFLPTRPETCSS